jgi:hypothetical protein
VVNSSHQKEFCLLWIGHQFVGCHVNKDFVSSSLQSKFEGVYIAGSSLDILTVDEKLLVFKEIKIIFTRYDFDLLIPVG